MRLFTFFLILILVLIIHRPCIIHKIFGENDFICKEFIGGGFCGLSPLLSSLICGKTCGFCPRKTKQEIQNNVHKNWKSIDRINYQNISYDHFIDNYLTPGNFMPLFYLPSLCLAYISIDISIYICIYRYFYTLKD